MATKTRAAEIEGKTITFSWAEGPTKGTSQEHHFNKDGSLSYKMGSEGKKVKEERYGAFKVADDAFVVSYLAKSGYTLTVTLNFQDGSLKGFASNEKEWYPCAGTFEVLD